MLTAHDLLTLSACAGAGRPLPGFAVTPEQATAILNAPASDFAEALATGSRPSIHNMVATDPISFADAIDGADWLDYFEHGAPEEMARFRSAVNQVLDQFSVHSDQMRGPNHPITELEEAVLSLWSASWLAGVRAGAAFEHLRLAMVPARMLCPTCDGNGRTWGGSWLRDDRKPAVTCSECGGAGTVATPAATLPFGG